MKNSVTDFNQMFISDTAKGKKMAAILLFFIIVVTLVVYSFSANNGFVNYDDNYLITGNEDILKFNWENITKFFTNQYYGHYHPFTMISFALNYQIGELNPFYYHVTNIILHLLNIVIAFFLFIRLTKRADVTAVITLFFALHPIQTETVSWLGARSNLLVTFFILLSLFSYVNYIIHNYKWKHLLLSFIFFVFALLSKSQAVIVPVLFFLFDYYLSRKLSFRLFIEKVPFFLGSLLFGLLAVASAKAIGSIYGIIEYSGLERILMVSYSIFFYISMFFFPNNQSAVHYEPWKTDGMLPIPYYIAPIVILGIIALIFMLKKYRKDLLFSFLFYFISIVLIIRIVPIGSTIVCERYAYLPVLGLAFLVGKLYQNLTMSQLLSPMVKQYVIIPFFLLLFMGYSVLTYGRNKVWESAYTLFNDVIEKYPERGFAYYAKANMEAEEKKYDAAIADYSEAIAREPFYMAYYNRGNVKLRKKSYEEAILDYNEGLKLNPYCLDLYNVRGSALCEIGKYDEAIRDFDHILEEKPNRGDIYHNRALLYSIMGDYTKAISDYSEAIRLDSSFMEAYANRGNAWMASFDTTNACRDWYIAATLNSNSGRKMLFRFCTPEGEPKKIASNTIEVNSSNSDQPKKEDFGVVASSGNEVIIEDKLDGNQNRLVVTIEKTNQGEIKRLKRYSKNQILVEDGVIDDNGNYDGEVRWFYENGKVKIKGYYKNTTPYGSWSEFYPSGSIKSEYSYQNGLMHGSYKYYYEQGNIWTERAYNEGRLWNIISNKKKDGSVLSPGSLKDGTGTVIIYDENGAAVETQTYSGGKKV